MFANLSSPRVREKRLFEPYLIDNVIQAISQMGTLIHSRSFRVKQIDFVAYLGDRQPDSH